jgi:hypothetical protein
MPSSVKINVSLGQKVKGGETVIGELWQILVKINPSD